jgi:hypothetical protein
MPHARYALSADGLILPMMIGLKFVIDQLVVMELPQPLEAAEAILGLDVIRQLLLAVDGPAGDFTLGD